MTQAKRNFSMLPAAVLVAAFGLAGCTGMQGGMHSGMHGGGHMAKGSPMAMMPGDMVLNDAVSAALTQAMGNDAKDIKVTNKDNVVTLTGWVNHPDQLSKALATAGRVPGVKKAYSQIHTWSSEN